MVPGEGPQPCLGMVVGEAPGRSEVAEGRPFVGRAGKLLETALRAVGVVRNEVYITNVVKDLPLDSEGRIRRPFPEEIEGWRSILEGEIQAAAPVALLALGRTAAEALTGYKDVPFGSKVGNVYTAWHPAYVLRRGSAIPSFKLPEGEEVLGTFGDWLLQVVPWAEAVADAA